MFNQIKIDSELLSQARDQWRKQLQKMHESQLISEIVYEKTECNVDWTICQQVLTVNKALKRSFSFFVYSQ